MRSVRQAREKGAVRRWSAQLRRGAIVSNPILKQSVRRALRKAHVEGLARGDIKPPQVKLRWLWVVKLEQFVKRIRARFS